MASTSLLYFEHDPDGYVALSLEERIDGYLSLTAFSHHDCASIGFDPKIKEHIERVQSLKTVLETWLEKTKEL